MLKRLADLLGATGGVQFGTYNSATDVGAIVAPRLGPDESQRFSEYWSSVWRRGGKHVVGAVIVPEMLISRGDPGRTNLLHEWSKTRGREATMGTILSTDGLLSTVLSMSRPSSKGNFDTSEVELFGTLIPHLQRGLKLLRLHLSASGGPPASSAEMCSTG
jgi:hypothetical protein